MLNRVERLAQRKKSEFSNGFQRFPEQPNAHSILLVFKDYAYKPVTETNTGGGQTAFTTLNNRSSGVSLRTSQAIELPFPKQLVDTSDLRVNGFERDMLTESIASKVNNYLNSGSSSNISDLPGMLQSMGAGMAGMLTGAGGLGGSVNSIAKSFMGTDVKDIASGAQYLLRSKIPGDIGRSIDNVTGQTINPRETLSFEGVNLRTHSFTWDLFPSSVADSNRIKNIVDTIKRKSLPEVTSLAGIPKAFLQYPSTVDMYLLGVNSEHFIKYKTSMVTGFTVDYGSQGMGIMKGGKPAAVNIALNLTELEIETAHDYGAGVNSIQEAPSLQEEVPFNPSEVP